MFAYLRGRILAKSNNYLILETNNVGYQIFVGEAFWSSLKVGEEQEFYLSHQVRADASDLYGFRNLAELELFQLLLSVSGVGPKSALGVLSVASIGDIREAVIRGDAALLTKVAGIGKKTAERVVLELKNKIVKSIDGASLGSAFSSGFNDELDALLALGYSLSDARNALSELDVDLKDSGERVKAALKKLSRKNQ
ncbi:MAG TPA: Holliday junction branch migration protein RuvA [bacterium]|jgi:Holliday junction DNA helicase RuvA|nr:Holliday junction branch migration protein RuvA [bacterium]HPY99291.1 Holliday junction branch migration protein RuvA [bacterium]HQB76065.1 Holliday junction branch migration protein RuvA [bacterium]HQL34562.1 Holliday junction branch migration protein RuvA [bacterium]HQO10936.1 Holliday junction branch migration protein RuvA [bacterium]